jgi:hypothetical protein
MSHLPRKSWRLFAIAAIAGAVTGFALPPAAHAASDHELNFTFGGRGNNPGVVKMHHYILGCLPNKTWIWGGTPSDSAGPWDVEVPKIKNHEYTNAEVRNLLLSNACASVRPKKVQDVAVTDS